LMIRAVPGERVSHIMSPISSVRGRQAAEAARSKQLPFYGLHNRFSPVFAQHRVRQAYGKNLIRAHGSVRTGTKNAVVKTCGLVVPEQFVEALSRAFSNGGVLHPIFRISNPSSDIFHRA